MKTTPALIGFLLLSAAGSATAGDLEQPVRLKAKGKLIDTDIGHAAPFVTDFDGDGKKDLLVGQFGGGKLKVYRNTGTDAKPEFAGFEWFKGTVPSG